MKLKIKAILMAWAILCPVTNLLAQSAFEKIDALMNSAHKNKNFDGAVLVAYHDSVIYKNGFGKADIETGIPNLYNTPFYIASLSKPFTAVLVMQLVQSKRIDLGATLNIYFQGLKDEKMRNVTIHQMLSHTSGIPDFIGGDITSEKIYTDQWFTEKLNQLTMDSAAGKKFKYANSTYVLLAHIIEKVTGKSYGQNLEENIFERAGMRHSGSLKTGQRIKNLAKGYVLNDSTILDAPAINPAIFKGAGSIYSTAEDLYKFDQAMYTDVLLNSAYKEMMFSKQGGSYGYGWFIANPPFGKILFHEGDLPGFTSLMFRAIGMKCFIVLLSNNQSNDAYKQNIAKQIMSIINGRDKD